VAATPETSRNTSIHEQINERQKPARSPAESRDGWLAPISGQSRQQKASDRRASNDESIPLKLDKYLKLLNWTGRQIRLDKRGAIPSELTPILDRKRIQSDRWLHVVTHFRRLFKNADGSPMKLRQFAQLSGCQQIKGIASSRASFL
jgi:hypothetical protein